MLEQGTNEKIKITNDNMFEHITSTENVTSAHKKTNKAGGKYKRTAILFNLYANYNLDILRTSILNNNYKPSGYYVFQVNDNKSRKVHAPFYVDKIVQHMINNILREFYEPKFIYDSYACIRDKGTQRAVHRIQQFQRAAYRNYKEPTLVKLDIYHFFYEINRDILKKVIGKKITCKRTLELLYNIIDNFNEPRGLPLGNLTSQLFANIILNELDQYIKHVLKIKYYVRYADDMFIIVDGKENGRLLSKHLQTWVKETLDLEIKDKKIVISNTKEIIGLGFKIYKDKIRLLGRNKRKFIKYAKEHSIDSLNSWLGYMSIADNMYFIKKVLSDIDGIVYLNNKFMYEDIKK